MGVSGCSKMSEPSFSTRSAPTLNVIKGNSASEAQVASQAQALTQMSAQIIRKSTGKGAAIGALAGCGMVLLSAANAKNCLTGAAAGAVVGAVVGHANGQKQVAKRVELVSPSALVKSIGKANDEMEALTLDLPTVLAQQDAEIASLTRQLESGRIDTTIYAARTEQIRGTRAQIAEALTLTAAQANEANRNLQGAAAQGQTGLDWHMNATSALAKNAMSARASISLL